MVKSISTKSELKNFLKKSEIHGPLGFVPTMGNLHDGHLSLINQSVKENNLTVVSIFVNPTQFGENEDFGSYPRTLNEDIEKIKNLSTEGNIVVFCPSNINEVYPLNFKTDFSVKSLEKDLCAKSRPGHFSGVLSVIYHLFHLVSPNTAYFGQKDYQQYLIIKKFSADLFPKIQIKCCPIVRDSNGLALSSRNNYLTSEEQKEALFLKNTIDRIARDISKREFKKTEEYKSKHINFEWDYLEVFDASDLSTINKETKNILIAGALNAFGKVRLIDNTLLEINHV